MHGGSVTATSEGVGSGATLRSGFRSKPAALRRANSRTTHLPSARIDACS